ncbi:mitochondrial 37S ribosomal protein uS17m MRPS17 [Rhodotorula paludigena]|uniref:mitochondrial 37S ribosomal protein uS17m MRPS17 n=1 Tax=Rhodotorula paludigena TaxID=86838 RepID=UPI00317F1D43
MLRTASTSARAIARALQPCTCPHPAPLRLFSSSPAAHSTPLPAPASRYTLPKGLELKGTVVAAGRMAHTVTVSVERRMVNHKTLKEYSQHTKYLVHDPAATCIVGDQVKIRNCRPVSARKRFELVNVVKGARERLESHRGPGAVAEGEPAAPTAAQAQAQA